MVGDVAGDANTNGPSGGEFGELVIVLRGNFEVALKSYYWRYFVAENNDAKANRKEIGPWEIFTMEFIDETHVAFKSFFNKYLVAELNGDLNANRIEKGPWEVFEIITIGDGKNKTTFLY